jgi:5-methylcytosine-specific restriction endonuclease McrA
MLSASVLVLNRSYLPIHVTPVRRAFSLVYQGAARFLDGEYVTFDFEGWCRLAVRAAEEGIGTVRGRIRVPRVIVLNHFDRVPKRHLRFSRANVLSRDDYTCQYCGVRRPRSDLNLDHVIPRALGGKSTWENVVASCVDCNRHKGGRTPVQAGLDLQRRPTRPRWTPLAHLPTSSVRHHEWRPFLHVVDGSRRAQRHAT